MSDTPRGFDPTAHLTKLKGGAAYLEVKWRLVWFREEHPDWGIESEPVVIDVEKGYAIFTASIKDETGRVIGQGTKMESMRDFGDYVEKANTGSIGRALAVCGYGTQFAPDMEEGERIVDAPVNRVAPASPPKASEPRVSPDTLGKLKKAGARLKEYDEDAARALTAEHLPKGRKLEDLSEREAQTCLKAMDTKYNAILQEIGAGKTDS